MEENLFFKPTLLYKEYLILDLIAKDAFITQRVMSEALGVSVSLVNGYLDKLELTGYIKRSHQTSKTVKYSITQSGFERVKVDNIGFIKSSYIIYESARINVIHFFEELSRQNKKKILLYGAGEVASVLISTLNEVKYEKVMILGIIDDDRNKQGQFLHGIPINSLNIYLKTKFDGILIASHTNHDLMRSKLLSYLCVDLIIDFFTPIIN